MLKIMTEYEVREELRKVKPRKLSYSPFIRARNKKVYPELDGAIEHFFSDSSINVPYFRGITKLHNSLSFSEDPLFINLVKEKREILDVMKEIKRLYLNEIVKFDLPLFKLIEEHMHPLIRILDTRLSAEEFYRRAKLIKENLQEEKRTKLEDSVLSPEIYKKEARTQKERELYRQIFAKKTKKKFRKVNKLNTQKLLSRYNQSIINQIRLTPTLKECVENPDASIYIPFIKIGIKEAGEKENSEKLSVIFRNKDSVAYRNFISKIKRHSFVQQAVLDNMIDNYSSGTKKPIKFEIMNLDSDTLKEIISYYNMDSRAGDFIISLHKNYSRSLINLINDSYKELMNDRNRWN